MGISLCFKKAQKIMKKNQTVMLYILIEINDQNLK